ncbi:MAG: hypothetical protein D3924_08445 [Candidatus Electrothrix sp. AR4]|nr:hypothetical protein [Candidatus Electrothrix sp. AR4]
MRRLRGLPPGIVTQAVDRGCILLIVSLALLLTSSCSDPMETLKQQLTNREQELGRANVKIGSLEAELTQARKVERPLRSKNRELEDELDKLRRENEQLRDTKAKIADFLTQRDDIMAELRRLREMEKGKKQLNELGAKYSMLLKKAGPAQVAEWLGSIRSLTEQEFKDFSSASLTFHIPKAGSATAEFHIGSKFINPAVPPTMQIGSATVKATTTDLDFENAVAEVIFPDASKLAIIMDASKTDLCNVIISHGNEKIVAVFQMQAAERGWLSKAIPFSLIEFKYPNAHFVKEQDKWVTKS